MASQLSLHRHIAVLTPSAATIDGRQFSELQLQRLRLGYTSGVYPARDVSWLRGCSAFKIPVQRNSVG
jgi:hypothetical protein